jgi:uncharacterized protein (DUF1800 family)
VGQLWRFGEQQGLGQADFTSLIKVLEGWAGVEVRSGANSANNGATVPKVS